MRETSDNIHDEIKEGIDLDGRSYAYITICTEITDHDKEALRNFTPEGIAQIKLTSKILKLDAVIDKMKNTRYEDLKKQVLKTKNTEKLIDLHVQLRTEDKN